ncbi:hypothetical protein QJQ45_017686 [Haematococcus lacustris]|nr:hypothetical protein QJQ45_017686 [Haematococcus lacustris]
MPVVCARRQYRDIDMACLDCRTHELRFHVAQPLSYFAADYDHTQWPSSAGSREGAAVLRLVLASGKDCKALAVCAHYSAHIASQRIAYGKSIRVAKEHPVCTLPGHLGSTVQRAQPVLLVDVNAYLPPAEYKVEWAQAMRQQRETDIYTEEEVQFQERVFARSGLHPQRTYLPPSLNPRYVGVYRKTGLAEAGVEAQLVLGGALEGLLAKTGLAPRDIDILVTTCSIYCPTPSLASMMINRFKLRADVQSYSLGGMGCSNGVVAVNLVKDLLQARPNSNAVFLTTEVTTPAFYPGHDKHRLVTNTLFRMGAAAMLMSNKAAAWAGRAKYQLVFNHRVHIGASDEAFSAIHYSPDDQGINGVYLGKNVVTEASRALTKAMWAVGPYVLTPRQKAEFAANWVRRRLLGPQAVAPYQPRFSGAVQHFLLHAGGAKVLEGLGKALLLSEHDLEPSRAVLRDYGNVSSSTTWYTLSYVETVRGVNKGDKVMQVGVGSGIKCGVNVWKALRDVKEVHEVWEECVTQDQAAAARAARALRQPHVDGAHAGRHLATRGVFLLLLLALLLLLHSLLALDLGQWGAGVQGLVQGLRSVSVWGITGADPGQLPCVQAQELPQLPQTRLDQRFVATQQSLGYTRLEEQARKIRNTNKEAMTQTSPGEDGPHRTPPVTPDQGAKQGCPISPLLFALYVHDISKEFLGPVDAVRVQGTPVTHFMYADDLTLVSTSSHGLQRLVCQHKALQTGNTLQSMWASQR